MDFLGICHDANRLIRSDAENLLYHRRRRIDPTMTRAIYFLLGLVDDLILLLQRNNQLNREKENRIEFYSMITLNNNGRETLLLWPSLIDLLQCRLVCVPLNVSLTISLF